MAIITLANQKGGVAKTSTALALASGFSDRGDKVLAIDLDPQGNFSFSCGVELLEVEHTIYDVFKGTASAESAIIPTTLDYDLIPGGLNLAGADMDFTQTGREFMLVETLQSIKQNYDYIIIDTPPTLGILTVNALTASDAVVVPMAADVYSLQGLSQLNGLITNVRRYCNKDLTIAGLLITRFNGRQNLSKALSQQIETSAEQLGTKVFNTRIRESVAIREAQLLHSDIFKEAPKANATLDYNDFIDELIGGLEDGK